MMIKKYLLAKTSQIFELFQEDIGRAFDKEAFNYAFIRGELPICLVAHIDTVRDEAKPLQLVEANGVIRAENSVLGADDRAGVYALARLYKEANQKPSILLTDLEETGGLGVKAFCCDYPKLPFNCNLFIELDRKGSNDYVTYNNLPLKVRRYIESFGFQESYGSYSDIFDLTETYGIPSVNLSVGYYNQHTIDEFLVLDTLEATIKRVGRILENPIPKLYKVVNSIWSMSIQSKRLKKRHKWSLFDDEKDIIDYYIDDRYY